MLQVSVHKRRRRNTEIPPSQMYFVACLLTYPLQLVGARSLDFAFHRAHVNIPETTQVNIISESSAISTPRPLNNPASNPGLIEWACDRLLCFDFRNDDSLCAG